MFVRKVVGVALLIFALLCTEAVRRAQSAEELVGKTERMSPLVWFCDAPKDLDVLLKSKTGRPVPDKLQGCRKFEDGALITIHAMETRNILGVEAILFRVAVDGYGIQYVIYGWRQITADEI